MQIDSADLAAFQAGMRRRYSDDEILAELKGSATRLGRSPTMREFERDRGARIHPQTVIDRFGTWNAAKRLAGLRPRRFATRDELLEQESVRLTVPEQRLRTAARAAAVRVCGPQTSPAHVRGDQQMAGSSGPAEKECSDESK